MKLVQWVCKDGKILQAHEMSLSHIVNSINFFSAKLTTVKGEAARAIVLARLNFLIEESQRRGIPLCLR